MARYMAHDAGVMQQKHISLDLPQRLKPKNALSGSTEAALEIGIGIEDPHQSISPGLECLSRLNFLLKVFLLAVGNCQSTALGFMK